MALVPLNICGIGVNHGSVFSDCIEFINLYQCPYRFQKMIIKYLQLPFNFDSLQLKKEVAFLDVRAWQLHYQKVHYEGEWTALPLRSIDGLADNVVISPIPDSHYQDTIFLKESTYLQEVLSNFKCPLQAVRLLKLNAGAVIKEHRDAELGFEYGEIRLHIPVITHEEVEFYLDKERIQLQEGECWYMNFNLPHAVINKSKINRIHLVIDATVNDWVKDLFSKPSVNKKLIEEPGHSDAAKKQMIKQLRQMNTETATRMADEIEVGL